MTGVNYYKILGIKDFSTIEEIKKAYRALAFRYHPDHNKGGLSGEARFREIKEAYEVLTDPVKKRQFDARLGSFQFSAPAYGIGKIYSEMPPSAPNDRTNTPAEAINKGKNICFWKPVVLILITIALMYLIMDPPPWLANIFGNK